jgi:DNA polymerase III delta prime subunit
MKFNEIENNFKSILNKARINQDDEVLFKNCVFEMSGLYGYLISKEYLLNFCIGSFEKNNNKIRRLLKRVGFNQEEVIKPYSILKSSIKEVDIPAYEVKSFSSNKKILDGLNEGFEPRNARYNQKVTYQYRQKGTHTFHTITF